MPTYIENPKTKGSGVICCIPQTGACPMQCPDCFFQSGRSYLEPLEENLPNMPSVEEAQGRIVRVNDGNDSNNDREAVMAAVAKYPARFYNTANPDDLDKFDAPVVLTVNPGKWTDGDPILLDHPIPPNLMFVRVRTNTWNLFHTVDLAVKHYTSRKIPVILTFMAYYQAVVPPDDRRNYVWRKRTLNSYWAITTDAWEVTMFRYGRDALVYSCGKVEGEKGLMGCKHCGNCLREYYAAMERLRP